MRILAIGDFHGKFPSKLRKEAKKVDLILSSGDFPNFDKIRKIIFKHWTGKNWWEVFGLKRARKLEKESFNSGLKIIKQLNKLKKKSYIVFGNIDFCKDVVSNEPKTLNPGYYEEKIKKLKNLFLIHRKKKKINNINILGFGGYVDASEYIKSRNFDSSEKDKKRRLKRYKRDENRLKKLFKKKAKDFIFLIHFTPFGIFDKVKYKKSPMYGKHVGWLPYNKIIKKYKPLLVICGHMHEYQGKKKLGKTWIVNPGPASEGKAAIIEIDEEKKKVKSVKFIR